MCIQKGSLQNKILMGFKIWRSWRPYPMKIKIPIGRTIFLNLNTKVTIINCNLTPKYEVFHNFCLG